MAFAGPCGREREMEQHDARLGKCLALLTETLTEQGQAK